MSTTLGVTDGSAGGFDDGVVGIGDPVFSVVKDIGCVGKQFAILARMGIDPQRLHFGNYLGLGALVFHVAPLGGARFLAHADVDGTFVVLVRQHVEKGPSLA